jgi:hypothetical protein
LIFLTLRFTDSKEVSKISASLIFIGVRFGKQGESEE